MWVLGRTLASASVEGCGLGREDQWVRGVPGTETAAVDDSDRKGVECAFQSEAGIGSVHATEGVQD
jgi:hypothetical protein